MRNSVADMVVCDSEVEEKFAVYLDGRRDVPLFLKLPEWYKVPTPLGNYNPDWAFVRNEDPGRRLYLVRETKGTSDIEKLQWEAEGWKIRFGEAHYKAIDVDYAFGHDPVKLIEPTVTTASVVSLPASAVTEQVGPEQRFTTHLPVYSLQAAAGYFGDGHDVETEGWVDVSGSVGIGALDDAMFVSQVVGRSMETRIPDGSYCIFRRVGAGTRNGKIVLAQHRDIADPETGGSYTIKRYQSAKRTVDGEVVGTIELQPLNSEYQPIVLTDISDDEIAIIGELVEVLG